MRVWAWLLFALPGCTTITSGVRYTGAKPVPERVAFEESSDRAFDATVRALVASGWSVDLVDRATGSIQTDYRATGIDPQNAVMNVSCVGPPHKVATRQLRMSVFVAQRELTVVPRTEICRYACVEDARVTNLEQAAIEDLLTRVRVHVGAPPAPPAAGP